jgi:hypothetical protein
MPVSERIHDTERLVFGLSGEGSSSPAEFVVELIVRDGAGGRKRGVDRALEGWAVAAGVPCELSSLQSLKHLMTKKPAEVRAYGQRLPSYLRADMLYWPLSSSRRVAPIRRRISLSI